MHKCTAEVAVFVVCSGFVGVLRMQQLVDDLLALSVVGVGFVDTLTVVAFHRLVDQLISRCVMHGGSRDDLPPHPWRAIVVQVRAGATLWRSRVRSSFS